MVLPMRSMSLRLRAASSEARMPLEYRVSRIALSRMPRGLEQSGASRIAVTSGMVRMSGRSRGSFGDFTDIAGLFFRVFVRR